MYTLSVGDSEPRKFKIGAEAIMFFEGTDHSHKFISWKDDLGLRWVAEAKGGGVRMLSNKRFKEEAHIRRIYQYTLNREEYRQAMAFLWFTLAKNYSYKQVLGMAVMRVVNFLIRIFSPNYAMKNPFTDGAHSMVCNEFAVGSVCAAKSWNAPEFMESWGLKETASWNHKTCDRLAPPEKIDRINGLVAAEQ